MMRAEREASHPCAACGGSGDTLSTTDIPAGMECGVAEPEGAHILNGPGWVMCGMPAKYRDKTKRAGDGMYDSGDGDAFLCAYHAEDGRYRPCPVCLGEGRISDKIPARDAVADAETLRLEAIRKDYGVAFVKCGTCYVPHGFAWLWNKGKLQFVQPLDAIIAGRVAFLAVPGLRGENG